VTGRIVYSHHSPITKSSCIIVSHSILGWPGTSDHAFPSSATSSDLGLAGLLLRMGYEAAPDALLHHASCRAHVVDGPCRIHGHAGNIVHVSLRDSLVDAQGATYSLVRSVGQIIEDLEAALFADELRQRFELEFECRHLLARLLELVVVGFDLLLASLVLFVKDHEVFFHDLFAAGELMIHKLQLVQILFAVDQLVEGVLEAISFFFEADLFLLLDDSVGISQLLSLILDLFLVLSVLLQNELFLLLHDLLFLRDDLLDPIFDSGFHLFDLVLFGLLSSVENFFKALILIVHLLDSELVLDVFLLENGNFVLLLFDLNLTLGDLFDELLIFVLELDDLLHLSNVFSFHNLVLDATFAILVPFDHQGLEKNVDFVDVIELGEVGF
jgi:hypothetical protein